MPWYNNIPWFVYAIAGAVFAGATNVFIKAGMKGVDSNLATAVRTLFAVPILCAIAWFTSPLMQVKSWTRLNWLFILLSAGASGLSWVCMYKSISMPDGGIIRTLPIDKSSIAFGFILAVIFLREKPNWQSIVATLLVLAALGVTLIPSPKPAATLPALTNQSVK